MGRPPADGADAHPGARRRRRARLLIPPSPLRARLARALARGAALVVILDYDGTLTPIARTPQAAVLGPAARRTLRRLAATPGVRVAVLSGRSLRDVRALVGVDGVVFGGCHGFEIAGRGLRFVHPAAGRRAGLVRAARGLLAAALRDVPGALVEDKGLAVSVHYRLVPRPARAAVLAAVDRVARAVPGLTVIAGKQVRELLPRVPWDKGRAARWITRRLRGTLPRRARPPVIVFAGDDTTDEAAFAALRPRGVTVRVGKRRGGAEYRVAGVRELHRLLRWLAERGSRGRR